MSEAMGLQHSVVANRRRLSSPPVAPLVADFTTQEAYEVGAELLSLLAYPAPDQAEQRLALKITYSNLALHARALAQPAWATQPQPIKPIYGLPDLRMTEKVEATAKRQFRKRMIASRMALVYLQQAKTGRWPRLSPNFESNSLNKICEAMADETNQDAQKVKNRVWRPSRPVLHLAAAVQVQLHAMQADENDCPVAHFIARREVSESTLERAIWYRQMLADSKAPVSLEDLVEIVIRR